jgi:hypothetical protein
MINKISTARIEKALGVARVEKLEEISIEYWGDDIVVELVAMYPLENETTLFVNTLEPSDNWADFSGMLKSWVDGLKPNPENPNWRGYVKD